MSITMVIFFKENLIIIFYVNVYYKFVMYVCKCSYMHDAYIKTLYVCIETDISVCVHMCA